MNCPRCNEELKQVEVNVEGAENRVVSYQCGQCDYFAFEPRSAQNVITELREAPLKMRQKVVKLSKDRLGIYLNRHVVESLKLQKGAAISVSVPDRKHIVLELD